MDYLIANPWWGWLSLAILTALAEVALPYFTFILATAGALAAAVVSIRYPVFVQAVTFCLATIASLILVRPLRVARTGLPSRSRLLVGASGRVTTALARTGRVEVAGEDWAARAEHELAVGQRIKVIGSDGIVLLVQEDQDGIIG